MNLESAICTSAKIYGVMTMILPIKETKKEKAKYFDRKLSDRRSSA